MKSTTVSFVCVISLVLVSCGTLFLTVNTYVSDERSYETSKANTQEEKKASKSGKSGKQ